MDIYCWTLKVAVRMPRVSRDFTTISTGCNAIVEDFVR